jgi:hypothetical protein
MTGLTAWGGERALAQPRVVRPDRELALPRSTFLEMIALAAFGAAVSLALTGYQFGIINNLFHLPIVARLYDEPQFRTDSFIQSLRYYSSGVWMLLEGSDRIISPYWLFLGLDYLSRLLSFVGFLCCGTLLGVETRRERTIFVIVLCFSSLLQGYSYPGNGGLFVNYFTHSEIANGTILLTFYFAVRGRFAEALALNGVTFFINAFMATWTVLPLGLIAVSQLSRREVAFYPLLLRIGTGLVLGGVLALPVLWNIAANPDLGAKAGVDFRQFFLDYYPDHVIFMIATPRHMLALGVTIIYGYACLVTLGNRSIGFRAALWGSVLLFAVGIVLPMVTALPLVLDFHLIRSSSVIYLLAALASATLATKWLCDVGRAKSKILGPLLVFADCSWRLVQPLGLVVIVVAALTRRTSWRRFPCRLDYAIGAALVLVIWPRLAWQEVVTNRGIAAQTAAWTAVGDWARRATPPDTVFLIPTKPLPSDVRVATPATGASAPDLTEQPEIFEFASHRRVWTDVRRGAAVMWTPSYYATWRPLVSEVLALRTLDDRLVYAHEHGIAFVIDACRDDTRANRVVVFRNDNLCVFRPPSEAGDPTNEILKSGPSIPG